MTRTTRLLSLCLAVSSVAACAESPTEPTGTTASVSDAEETPTTSSGALVPVTYTYAGGFLGEGEIGLYMPRALGCWEREGLDVTVETSTQQQSALQRLISGDAQVITHGPEVAPLAHIEGVDLVTVYTRVTTPNQLLAIPKGSDIQSLEELRGATIGVPAAFGTQNSYTRALLTEHGLRPDIDWEIVPLGFGGPEVAETIRGGRVDALTFWSGFFAVLENAGFEFTYYQLDTLANSPGYVISTSRDYLANNAEVIAALGRCEAQAAAYAFENPEAVARHYWELFPDNKPTDVSEEVALANAVNVIQKQLDYMAPDPEHGWGWNDPEGWEVYIDFLVQGEQLEEPVPVDVVMTNELSNDYNDFDEEAIRELARGGGT